MTKLLMAKLAEQSNNEDTQLDITHSMYRIHCNKHPCLNKLIPQLIELIFLNMPVFKSSFYHVSLLRYCHFKFSECMSSANYEESKFYQSE